MIKRTHISNAVAAALLAVSAQVAFAVDEVEPNDVTPQLVTVGTNGEVVIQGVIGTDDPFAAVIEDVDSYAFDAQAGDAITIDIDGAMKQRGQTGRQLDTVITLYGPTGESIVENHDTVTIDEGSAPIGGDRDSRIDEPPVALPVTGRYVVKVRAEGPEINDFLNGSYTLIIRGVSAPPQVRYVSIDIKPGDRNEFTRLNPKQKRDLPIALLSSTATPTQPAFNPLEAKVDSITFGRGGNEKSLVRCLKHHIDVNRDGMPDLVCLFDVPSAAFEEDDVAGKLKGETTSGMRFEAVGKLKVKPEFKHKDKDRPRWQYGKGHDRDDDRYDGKNGRR